MDRIQMLDVKRLGMAFGTAWSILTFFVGVGSTWLGWGRPLIELLGSVYIGFEPTLTGCLIGMLWGFANGFLWGAVIGWVYNLPLSESNNE